MKLQENRVNDKSGSRVTQRAHHRGMEARRTGTLNKTVPCPMRIKMQTIRSGKCFTCVVFYTYYAVTFARTYFQSVSSYARMDQRNLLLILQILHGKFNSQKN